MIFIYSKKYIFKIFIYKTKKTFRGVGTVLSLAEPVSPSWLLWWHTMLVRKGTCWSDSPALKHSLWCLSITSAGGFTPPPSTFPYLGKCSTAVSFTAPVLTAAAQQYLQQLPTSPRHQQLLKVGPGVAVPTPSRRRDNVNKSLQGADLLKQPFSVSEQFTREMAQLAADCQFSLTALTTSGISAFSWKPAAVKSYR